MASKSYTILADIDTIVYFAFENKVKSSKVVALSILDSTEETIQYSVIVRESDVSVGIITAWMSEKDIFLTEDEVII